MYQKVDEVLKRLDKDLIAHFEKENLDFYSIVLKWIICLLLRQFTPRLGLRIFDTYIVDDPPFHKFCIYIFIAIILKWSKKLKKMHFEDIMIFL
jgi:hypothetical protein